MTERLFDADGYLKQFQATVLDCAEDEKGWYAVLDRTAFFPEGGGQSGDTGWLDEIRVTDTVEKEGKICHRVERPLEIGAAIEGTVNFQERFDKMQQHTGEHILSGIVHTLYGYDNVGFHLGAELTTLDFNGELSKEQIHDLELQANEAVFSNLPVTVLYPTDQELSRFSYRSKIEIEGQVRLVEIPGIDLCACCAPHVKRTGEVGMIKITAAERHRGGCRLTMVCGRRAFRDYEEKQQSVGKISAALSAKPDQVYESVVHLQRQQQSLREQLNSVQERYFSEKLEKIRREDPLVCIFEKGLDGIAVRNFVNAVMERCDGICGVFLGNEKEGYRYILGSRQSDVRPVSKQLNEKFSGKGGGKPEMVQGTLYGKQELIEKEFKLIVG